MEFDASVLLQRTDDLKLIDMGRKDLMTFHCEQCSSVLGDSLGVCGELKCVNSIMCYKVTNDVIVSDEVESGQEGELSQCLYSSLTCSGCQSVVGAIIHSAPHHLEMVRSIFLLQKDNIRCYILNNSQMVRASELTFDLKPVGDSIKEMKRQLQAQVDLMSRIRKRLSKMSVASDTD
ncbi:protein Mis18-beta [Polymixia lowei]